MSHKKIDFHKMFKILIYEKEKSSCFQLKIREICECFELINDDPLIVFGKSERSAFRLVISVLKNGTEIDFICIEDNDMSNGYYISKDYFIKSDPDFKVNIVVGICTPFMIDFKGKCEDLFSKMVVIGHRGSGSNLVSQDYMENSIPGFIKAYENHADGVEFDVQLSKDQEPVIFHSFFMKEESHIEGVNYDMKEGDAFLYSLAKLKTKQIQNHGMNTKFKVECPTLEEILTRLPEELSFISEVKVPFSGLFDGKVVHFDRNTVVERTLDVVKQFGGKRKIIFTSFCPIIAMMFANKQTKYEAHYLTVPEKGESNDSYIKRFIGFTKLLPKIGVKGIGPVTEFILENPNLLNEIRKHNLHIILGGVYNNDEQHVSKLLKMDIDGIITDNLPLVIKIMKNNQ